MFKLLIVLSVAIFGNYAKASGPGPCIDVSGRQFILPGELLEAIANPSKATEPYSTPIQFSIDESQYISAQYVCSHSSTDLERANIPMTVYLAKDQQRCTTLAVLPPIHNQPQTTIWQQDTTDYGGRKYLERFAPIAVDQETSDFANIRSLRSKFNALHVSAMNYKFIRREKPRQGLFEFRLLDRDLLPKRTLVNDGAIALDAENRANEFVGFIFEESFQRKYNGNWGPSLNCVRLDLKERENTIRQNADSHGG